MHFIYHQILVSNVMQTYINLFYVLLFLNSEIHFSVMVQFHALGVLHQIRKSDKLAVTKMVSKLTSSGPRSPYAICLLVSPLLFSTFWVVSPVIV